MMNNFIYNIKLYKSNVTLNIFSNIVGIISTVKRLKKQLENNRNMCYTRLSEHIFGCPVSQTTCLQATYLHSM